MLVPTGTLNRTSTTFDSCFLHIMVISAGQTNTCARQGLVCLDSHSCSSAASATTGAGSQIQFPS